MMAGLLRIGETLVGKIRLVGIMVLGGLVLVIMVQAEAVLTTGEAVNRSMRYDIAMSGLNGRLDAVNSMERTARYAASGSAEDARGARLFHDILLSRIDTWSAGAFWSFVATSPERIALLERARAKVNGLTPLYERLEDPAVLSEIRRTLRGAVQDVTLIGSQAMMANLAEAEEIRRTLREHQQIQNSLVTVLIVFGAVLLAMMSYQARRLRLARELAERNARKFEQVAQRDPLTQLANRLAFDAALDMALLDTRETERQLAVYAIDLDGFKAVNDMLGHAAGDSLLVSVARRLEEIVAGWGAEGLVSRLGGDEFTVLTRVSGGVRQAEARAREMVDGLHAAHGLGDGNIVVNVTIGFALVDADAIDGDAVVQNADLALSHAKAAGKGRAQVYDASMREDATRRQVIEAGFTDALARGEIVTHYQPQVEMATGRIVGFEALARWRHAELGWIPPGEFVRIAEASGRIVEIGEHILRSACRDASLLPQDVPVSVNLSVAQLARSDLPGRVADILAESGLAAERLKLEVTESMVMSDSTRALSTMRRLKALGVWIALDDFGTGYSALSYLRDFAWDELKIDRSFVETLESDAQSLLIIRSIVELARRLSISVTVEGVETPSQCALLRRAGCRIAQGFYYGHAVPASELPAQLLRSFSRVPLLEKPGVLGKGA
ncbi:putative bifunctional diguanylate cyclase/phosphodiesterase [Stappia stellulata]|uniref:putative bifunctional diguanylate cyclase/phosphodiesterase n=1 Tax=Stappia stellulata TaxID=71235 RepID=UPI00040D8F88|nr:EAL domain-containing protein [Stappia stellulata]